MKNTVKTLEPLAQSVLLTVFELAGADRSAHLGNVAGRLGLSYPEATRVLWALDGAGLLWAERCRLTMPGLLLAARLAGQRGRARRRAA